MNYAVLKGCSHELFTSERKDFENKDGNFRHIGYSVDSAGALLEAFKRQGRAEAGLQVVVKQFYTKDPDGLEIDLIRRTDKQGFYENLEGKIAAQHKPASIDKR